ncbi:sugar transferase [Mesoflavibacter zeaxanthinifaciens]|uniref:sugar transferase n=1 Tax=Mesoflavibacter zeaxanthinifaciens TaxID=393060 RepID=UPI003A8D4705
MYVNLIKPFFDITFALVLLLIASPIIILVMIVLTLANGGSPFFLQKRPGKKGEIFTIVKFRTMTEKKDKLGNLLPDAERITSIGRLVRSTSLDELPQLLNVLKADMSFVGPRPLLPQYLSLYNDFQKQRHNVKPGITGWAQVNGRNAISWQQKFEYDVWYVNNISLVLDFKILFLTIKKVFVKEGISQKGQATTLYFKGNDLDNN